MNESTLILVGTVLMAFPAVWLGCKLSDWIYPRKSKVSLPPVSGSFPDWSKPRKVKAAGYPPPPPPPPPPTPRIPDMPFVPFGLSTRTQRRIINRVAINGLIESARCLGSAQERNDPDAIKHWQSKVTEYQHHLIHQEKESNQC